MKRVQIEFPTRTTRVGRRAETAAGWNEWIDDETDIRKRRVGRKLDKFSVRCSDTAELFFEDLFGRPTFRTIELHHIAMAVFVLKLVNAVFIAVKRSEPGVHSHPQIE